MSSFPRIEGDYKNTFANISAFSEGKETLFDLVRGYCMSCV